VLAHPRSSDLARNAICVFRQGEQEDEDQVRIVNLRNMSREPARIDNSLHGLASCLHRRVGHWVAQVQVVDDDVHEPDLTPWGHHVLWRHSRTAHPKIAVAKVVLACERELSQIVQRRDVARLDVRKPIPVERDSDP